MAYDLLEENSGLGPEGAAFSRIIEIAQDPDEESARDVPVWGSVRPRAEALEGLFHLREVHRESTR